MFAFPLKKFKNGFPFSLANQPISFDKPYNLDLWKPIKLFGTYSG